MRRRQFVKTMGTIGVAVYIKTFRLPTRLHLFPMRRYRMLKPLSRKT